MPLAASDMRLILHLGAHRTGTTVLARCLFRGREALLREHISQAPINVLRLGPDGRPPAPLRALLRLPGPRTGELEAMLRARIGDCIELAREEGAETLLITEENILGNMRRNIGDKELYADLKGRLEVFARALPSPPRRIGIGLRDYAGYWLSAYVYVLRSHPLPLFQEIVDAIAGFRRGWVDVVTEVAAAFPESEILLWRHSQLEDAMSEIGAALVGRKSADGLPHIPNRVNGAGAGSDCDLIHRLRQEQPDLSGKPLEAALKPLRATRSGPSPAFTAAQVAAMTDRYAQDLARLAALGPRVSFFPNSQGT